MPNKVELRFSKLFAVLIVGIGPPIYVAMAGFLAFLITNPSPELPVAMLIASYVLFLPTIVFFLTLAWISIYFRETFFTTFRFSTSGVRIENMRYGTLTLEWRDVESVSHWKLLKAVILRSPKLVKPIAFMNNAARFESEEFRQAVACVKQFVSSH